MSFPEYEFLEIWENRVGEVFKGRIVYNDGSVFNYTKGGRTTVANRRILDEFIKSPPISPLNGKR